MWKLFGQGNSAAFTLALRGGDLPARRSALAKAGGKGEGVSIYV